MDLRKYLEKGVGYEAYIERVEKEVEVNAPLSDYSELNLKRMQRVAKTFKLSENQIIDLLSIPNNFNVIIISEGWCGDASQSVPVFNKIFEVMDIEPQYAFRNENQELMQEYLTNGAEAIPILIALDLEGNELFHYGPRPQKGMEMLAAYKANPEKISKDDFYKNLQQFYNKDKGQSIYNELLALMKKHIDKG